jgi:hypothetical protein
VCEHACESNRVCVFYMCIRAYYVCTAAALTLHRFFCVPPAAAVNHITDALSGMPR